MTANIFTILLIIIIGTKCTASKKFHGSEKWKESELEYCENDPTPFPDYCLTYVHRYEVIKLELLQAKPPVVAYRGLAPRKYISDFLDDVKSLKKKPNSGVSYANEVTIAHKEKGGIARLFNRLATYLPFLNFDNSDPWQVLSFGKGAHHPPRYDFLNISGREKKDELTKELGNRFATFRILLKAADEGGAVIFTAAKTSIKIEPGDALFWITMEPNGTKKEDVEYGDCPVWKGEKVTATLRLRERWQHMVEAAREPGEYYYYVLTTPNLEFLRTSEKIDYDDDWSQFSSSNSTDDDYVYDEAIHGGHTPEESMKEHNHKKDEL